MPSRLRIGEVAALFDVTTKTLRHYEKLELLQPERADNGYRQYGPEEVLRIQRIRQLQSLGLPLKEIRRLLGRDDEALWEGVLQALREEAATEIAQLRERMERIEQLLDKSLPPAQKSLPAPPDRVNDYLEEHLPQATLETWRREKRIYASLHRYLDRPFGGRDEKSPLPPFPGQPLMVPSSMGGRDLSGFPAVPPANGHVKHNHSQLWRVLRLLQRYEASREEERK